MQRLPNDKRSITKKFLFSLPVRKWDKEKLYDSLFIVPANKMHDSGYRLQIIVGVLEKDAEIAAYCDDICWSFPKTHPYDRIEKDYHHMILRTDCFPRGIFRMWASGEHYFKGKFRVGCSLSSTNVTLEVHPFGKGVNKVTGEIIKAPINASI